MKIKVNIYIWILFFSYSLAANTLELTFEDCVAQASKTNPALLAAKSQLASSDHLVEQSYSNYYPQLSATLKYDYGNGFGESRNDTGGTLTPLLTATQNLFSGRADEARVSQSKANRKIKEADLDATKTQLSFDLKIAFSELARAQELENVNLSIRAQRETSFKLVSLLFESGREDQGSVLIAKANLAQANFAVERSKEAVLSASIRLSKTLGLEPSDAIRAKNNVPQLPLPSPPDFQQLSQQVPEYLRAAAQEEVAKAQLKGTHSKFFPRLDFNASVSQSESRENINMRWMAGLSLSYSFFNGGEDSNGYKSARESKTTAMLNKRSIQQAAASNIATAYYAFKSSYEQLDVDNAFLQALGTQGRIAKENYNNGRLTFQNWDLIETSYIQRQQAIVVSKQNLIAAAAAYEKAIGKGVVL